MSYQYSSRKRDTVRPDKAPGEASAPGPDLSALMEGSARPSAAQKGRSIDLDAAIKAKMEHAFGDLSAVKLYESPTVGQAGAEAMAMGNEIAFAPGMADFSSRSGQERLGHELSHVMSQRSGGVRGTGFLANASLEARADREGAMAAAGEQVYTGPVTHALSAAAPSPAAAGPMQAKRDDTDPNRGKANRKVLMDQTVDETAEGYDQLDPTMWEEREKKRGFFASLFNQQRHFYKAKIDRRPWEMTREELQKNRFNPNNVTSLTTIQDKIATAGSNITARPQDGVSQEVAQNGFNNRSAWMTFQGYSEAGDNSMIPIDDHLNEWDMNEVDHTAFTAKLKNMSRMVRDYPELEGNIGSLISLDQKDREALKETKNAQKNQTTYTDKEGKVKQKSLRQRLKQKKGSAPPVNLQPAPMEGYQPNLNWQQDDATDPGWVKDPNAKDNKDSTLVMSAAFNKSYSSNSGHQLSINADLEGTSNEARNKRKEVNESLTKIHGTTLDYAANHELGHMLNYELIKELNRKKSSQNQFDPETRKEIYNSNERYKANKKDFDYHITASRLVEEALRQTMPPEEFAKLVRYKEDSLGEDEAWDPSVQLGEDEEWVTKDTGERFLENQINLKASGLGATENNRGYTTKYGATNASEFFAEAFADVYQNGKSARPTSIRLVQLYEEEMKKAKAANKN